MMMINTKITPQSSHLISGFFRVGVAMTGSIISIPCFFCILFRTKGSQTSFKVKIVSFVPSLMILAWKIVLLLKTIP